MPDDAGPFDAFMRRALFDPQHGYYARKISAVGARGDFSTSASASPLLGAAIARWLSAEAHSQPDVRTIIEIGGGDGSLMAEVRKQSGWWHKRRFEYFMVETSVPLWQQQQARLGDCVRWFDHLKHALDACGGGAFIYHNELLDALPVTLIEWEAASQSWKEVWLRNDQDSRLAEELRPLRHLDQIAEIFSVLQQWNASSPPPHEQQRCELHTGMRRWLDEWAGHWRSGAMLAIDYGDSFPAWYHRRPRGTLRAYLLHQRMEGADVYQNIGRQDITTDINFTDLRAWCSQLGCTEAAFETQREFIQRHLGLRATARKAADRFILDADGAGSAFKCLTLRRAAR